jgi:hypothetical protein
VAAATASVFAARVRVRFSEPVLAATAEDTASYALPGFTVLSAVLRDPFSVDVGVSPTFQPGASHTLSVSFIQDTAGNAMPSAVPAPFVVPSGFPAMTNLVAAFNGGVTAAHAVDGVTWPDQSGNGNDAVAVSTAAGRRPTVRTNALNGLPALAFTAASQQALAIEGGTSTGLNLDDYTWFAVVRVTNIAAGSFPNLLRHQSTSNAANWGSFFFPASGTLPPGVPAGTPSMTSNGRTLTGSAVEAYASPVSNNTWWVVAGHADNRAGLGQVYARVLDPLWGGVAGATNQQTGPILFGPVPVRTFIGVQSTGSGYFGGEMAELLLYAGELSAADQQSIEAYLKAKYFPVVPTVTVTPSGPGLQVDYTGALQRAVTAEGPYNDVPGLPPSPLVVPAGSLTNQMYFRTRKP